MGKCISCSKDSQECVKITCPNCKETILRCDRCRSLSIEFKCQCGFQGP